MRLIILLTLLLFFKTTIAQNYFEKIYQNQNLQNIGTMDISPADKGFIFSGRQNEDYFLFKGDSTGYELWSRSYDSLNVSENSSAVCHLINGNFAFIGSGNYYYGDALATIGEVDSVGDNIHWTTYPLHDDGWATYGLSISTNPLGGYHFVTYDDGLVWTNYYYFDYDSVCGYDGSQFSPNCLSVNSANRAFVCTVNDVLPYPLYNGTTVLSNTGLRLNIGPGLNTSCIHSDNDSGFVVGNNLQNVQLRKFNSAGQLQWIKSYSSNSLLRIVDIEQNSSGKYFLLLSQAINGGDKIVLMSADSNGDSLWSRSFYGYRNASPINLKLYDNGDIIIFGSTLYDPYIIKTDSLGQINPQYSISGNGNFFCNGDTAVLSVQGGGASYLWSTGDTTQTIRLTSNTIASVVVTDSVGTITNTGIYSVSFLDAPVALISTLDTILSCSYFSMIDSAANHITTEYKWYLNDTLISTWSNGNYSRSGMAKLVVSNYCGIDSDMVYVNIPVNPAPVLFASPGTDFCEGDSILLSVNYPASTFVWINYQDTLLLSNFFGTSVYVKEGGIYNVRYLGNGGCLSRYSNAIALINRTPDNTVLYDSPLTFCEGDSVVLYGRNDYFINTYFWSSGDTAVSVPVKSSGCYSFYASNNYGCSSTSDTVCVSVLNSPTVDLGTDTILCINTTFNLDAGPGFTSYLWQDSTNSQSIFVSSSFADTVDYSVMVANANNCSASDTIRIIFDLCNNVNDNFTFDEFRIYPNPSSGIFKIYFPGNGSGILSIYDITGKQIREVEIAGKNILNGIDVSGLKKGVYSIKFKSEHGEYVKSLIIQ